MCGHVGVAGTMSFAHENAFKELLIVDVIRGPDSTGIAAYGHRDGLQIVKKPLLPNDLFTLRACEDIFNSFNHILMGHNRWATQGAVNGVNSHPFEMENLVGAHNGTLVNQGLLPDSTKFEVDSENILHSIEKIGVEDTWSRLHGAAALVWYEWDGNYINFLRNKERPMFITFTPDRKTLFWASESWMLEGVLAKNGIKHTEIFDTKTDHHYRMHIPQLQDDAVDGQARMTFGPTEAKAIAPFIPPPKPTGATTPPKLTVIPTSTEIGGTNTGDTDRHYALGDDVFFFLDLQGPTDERYILGIDSQYEDESVRIYCPKNSWMRSNLKAKDKSLYGATVNGFMYGATGDGVAVQANSCYQIADNDVEWSEIREWTEEEFSIDAEVEMQKTIFRSGGICGICSDDVYADPEHVMLTDDTIICKHCKDTQFGKEIIKG